MSRNAKAERDVVEAAKIDLVKAKEIKEKNNKQQLWDYYEKRKRSKVILQSVENDRREVDLFMQNEDVQEQIRQKQLVL